MKIFLNDRTIQFSSQEPVDFPETNLVVNFTTSENLQEEYRKFERYPRYLNMIIVEPSSPGISGSTAASWNPSFAMESFFSMFTLVEAAGGLVKNEKGEYLFIHRLGHWDLPKGKIEKRDRKTGRGDEKRVAALREVMEETGLENVEITRELPPTHHIYTEKEKTILKRTCWFEMVADSSQPLKPQISEGIFLVKWTPPKAIHCILSHTYASLREILLEEIF